MRILLWTIAALLAALPLWGQGQPRFPEIRNEGVNLGAYIRIDMVGAGVECVKNLQAEIICTFTGGGTGGHEIQGAGSPVTDRAALNFLSPFSVADNAGNDSSDVSLDINSLTNTASPAVGDNFLFQEVSGGAFKRITRTQMEAIFGGGGTPGGSGTELQYRSGASTFGAVPNSSWDGTTLGLPRTRVDHNIFQQQHSTNPTFSVIDSSISLTTSLGANGGAYGWLATETNHPLRFGTNSLFSGRITAAGVWEFWDRTDNTKRASFDLSAIGTSQTRSFIWPNLSGTIALTTGAQSILSKTIDSGIATTTHAAGANILQTLRHATDCTAITDGVDGELCYEKDADTIYVCEPTAGGCDTAGEWIQITSGGSGNVSQSAENDTDNTVARSVGTSGRTQEQTGVTISDSDQIVAPGGFQAGSGTFDLSRFHGRYVLFDAASALTTSVDIPVVDAFSDDYGVKVDKICAITDGDTATIQVQHNDGTAADVMTADLVATATGACSCADSGTEILNETAFATHADWDVTGDFVDSGGNAAYTHSTGSGTLTQTEANQANAPADGARMYRFDYTVSGVSGSPTCTITTGFADSAVNLTETNGAQTNWFLGSATPGNFVISCTSGAAAGITFDNLSLQAAPCSVDTISLSEDDFAGPSVTQPMGDRMVLLIEAIDASVNNVTVTVSGTKQNP